MSKVTVRAAENIRGAFSALLHIRNEEMSEADLTSSITKFYVEHGSGRVSKLTTPAKGWVAKNIINGDVKSNIQRAAIYDLTSITIDLYTFAEEHAVDGVVATLDLVFEDNTLAVNIYKPVAITEQTYTVTANREG